MKTYLPNYFKQIGILLVFTAIVLSFTGHIDGHRQAFLEGFYEGYQTANDRIKANGENLNFESNLLDKEEEKILLWLSLFFSISGFVIYLFSKEKIDDEYIQQIRLKSILQALLFSWLLYGLIKLFDSEYQMDGIYILQLQLIVYVILFRRNKNKELSEQEEELVLEN